MRRVLDSGDSRLSNGETRKARSDQVIYKYTFNLFYTTQADTFTFWWKTLREGAPYHDRRCRFR
jgi:hypothetical protein